MRDCGFVCLCELNHLLKLHQRMREGVFVKIYVEKGHEEKCMLCDRKR